MNSGRAWLCSLLCLMGSASSWAQIALNIRADATPKPPELNVQLVVTNQGKEDAHDIQINLRNGGDLTLPGFSVLGPAAAHDAKTNLNIAGKVPGKYPLYVTVGYTDRNGYQFSAILCATYFIEQNTSSDIFGTLKARPLADSGQMDLQLKNLTSQDRSFNLTVFTPRELSAAYEKSMTLRGSEEKNITIPLRNFSALPGSLYPLYAVVEYEKDGRHFTSVILTHVEIIIEIGLFTRYRRWILAAAGAFLILGVILVVVRFYRGRKRAAALVQQ